jgi:membrane associated rhomboid family serine protease
MLARPDTYSLGPSGVIYALWGVLFAFTFFDGIPNQPKSWNPRTWYQDKRERRSGMNNLALFAATAAIIIMEPAQFLSVGPNVNVFAHGISFLGGYFLAQVYRQSKKTDRH